MSRLQIFSGANNHQNKKNAHLTRVLASTRTLKTQEPRRALPSKMTMNQLTMSLAQRTRQSTTRLRLWSLNQLFNESQPNTSATPRQWTIAPQTDSHLKKTSCWRSSGTSSSSKKSSFYFWTSGRTENPFRCLSLLIPHRACLRGSTPCP